MTPLTLAERVLALDHALAPVPHAFGGALALAYYAEPRATIDIDINLFVAPDRYPDVADALRELGVDVDRADVSETVARDGQVRVMWDDTPVDLFFAYDAFHDAAARATRTVPFGDAAIPILAGTHLMVCKAVFDRPKDWVDIDAMLDANAPIDTAEVLRWVGRIAGDTDPRYERSAALLTRR
jgi:hypothetical protein